MKNVNKLAIVYCRNATSDQIGSKNTMGKQERVGTEQATKDGNKTIKVIKEIASGGSLKRKGVEKLIALIKKGRVGSVYVADSSRLSRNIMDYLKIKKLFKKYKVELELTDTQIKDSPTSKLAERMLAIFAEYEKNLKAEKRLTK